MQPKVSDPEQARQFALDVVSRLRAAGYQAFWAGGCVRDELLGRIPVDYDVATSAKPDEVRGVFGRRRTLAIGAAFGVITVLGPRENADGGLREAGQIEVATFRTDAAYTDGRHPAGVTFSSPEEDAQRRDFTINGLFLDPVTGEVHDYVGGREDLKAGVVRAIGVPAMRFGEDHLRMLRAVRFAAGFAFALDGETRAAIEKMTHLVTTVSPERIAAELRAMVSRPGRRRALELLDETGLAREVLREVAPADGDAAACEEWQQAARIIDALDEPDLSTALAALFERAGGPPLRQVAARLRLSNREAKLACWLLDAVAALGHAGSAEELASRPWSQVQPWLAHDDAFLLADLLRARADCGRGSGSAAAWVTAQIARPRDELDPPPLLTGGDLLAAGVPAGRAMGEMLARLRSMQLDGQIVTREAALEWVK
ncbi:MAG: CCA tRNA nucleotidyltransferase [Planctomycetia bacterium]|nr:CCA tRNA nucleotidyltransferase [Planctomycetia bacterium]